MSRIGKSLASMLVLAGVVAATGAAAAPPAGDPALGKRVFMRCMACHAVQPGVAGKIGPNLSGVVGRKAGSLPGFHYSPAMAAAGFRWDAARLDAWLLRPSTVVPGTTMAFPGLPDARERAAVIAYLKKPQ